MDRYDIWTRLNEMLGELEQWNVVTGDYELDEDIEHTLAQLAGSMEEALDAIDSAEGYTHPYQPDPSDLAKAEAELRDFLAYCNEVGA